MGFLDLHCCTRTPELAPNARLGAVAFLRFIFG
jgi:hypothetical protein